MFSRLALTFAYFRPEIQIPRQKLYILTTGHVYAHSEVLVTFLLVRMFCFLVIARNPRNGF